MKIITINGMHRSGTMLLSRLVNEFPDTFIIKDGVRIPWLYYRVETNETFKYPMDCYKKSPIKLDLSRSVRNIIQLKKIMIEELEKLQLTFDVYNCLKIEINKFQQGASYKEIYSHFYKKLSEILGVVNVGAKNTQMFQYKDAMLAAFPNLRWIDIVRDPRGWYCSAKVSHPLNIFMGTYLWNKAVNNVLKRNLIHNNRYIYITFEDLILNPKKTLQRLSDFLGMNLLVTTQWLEKLQLRSNDGSPWYPNPSYTKKGEKVFGDQNRRISTDYHIIDELPVYRWRTKLSAWEKNIIKIMTSKNIKRLYPKN